MVTGPHWDFQLRQGQPPERTLPSSVVGKGLAELLSTPRVAEWIQTTGRTLIKWDFPSISESGSAGSRSPSLSPEPECAEKGRGSKPSPGTWNGLNTFLGQLISGEFFLL